MTGDACPFCDLRDEQVVERLGPCVAIWTGEQPDGSAMVLPVAHRPTLWELSDQEWTATRKLLVVMRRRVEQLRRPDGWNVGWNVGRVGGQSVSHAHCHLIPRYADEPYAGRGLRWWFRSVDNTRP